MVLEGTYMFVRLFQFKSKEIKANSERQLLYFLDRQFKISGIL
jgi:hypothetical protein